MRLWNKIEFIVSLYFFVSRTIFSSLSLSLSSFILFFCEKSRRNVKVSSRASFQRIVTRLSQLQQIWNILFRFHTIELRESYFFTDGPKYYKFILFLSEWNRFVVVPLFLASHHSFHFRFILWSNLLSPRLRSLSVPKPYPVRLSILTHLRRLDQTVTICSFDHIRPVLVVGYREKKMRGNERFMWRRL